MEDLYAEKQNSRIIQVHMYLSKKDYDLLLLYKSRKLKLAVAEGIRKYLTKDSSIVYPLPEYKEIQPEKCCVSLYFSEDKDKQAVDFIESIQKGSVSTVLQILARSIFVVPDIRYYMQNTEKMPAYVPIKKSKKRQNKTTLQTHTEPNENKQTPQEQATQEQTQMAAAAFTPAYTADYSEEDVFAGI